MWTKKVAKSLFLHLMEEMDEHFLFKASHESVTNEGMIISKAEKIIQKSLFQ